MVLGAFAPDDGAGILAEVREKVNSSGGGCDGEEGVGGALFCGLCRLQRR